MPSARIEAMNVKECRDVLRMIVRLYQADSGEMCDLIGSLVPTPIDRLREFLESEGWERKDSAIPPMMGLYDVRGQNLVYYTHPEWK